MGAGNSGLFHGTKGSKSVFSHTGHVTLESISNGREEFLGKSVEDIDEMLQKYGYKTNKRKSIRFDSSAQIIEIINTSKVRNITQIQVSPGSDRHGNVPYVKISTTDIGKIKIIDANQSDYKTDGKETAQILFRRNKSGN